MSGGKGALLNLSEIVLRISIKIDLSDRDQGVVTVRDNFRDIENVKLVVFTSFLRNKLNIPGP
jgi:hypothetical protein